MGNVLPLIVCQGARTLHRVANSCKHKPCLLSVSQQAKDRGINFQEWSCIVSQFVFAICCSRWCTQILPLEQRSAGSGSVDFAWQICMTWVCGYLCTKTSTSRGTEEDGVPYWTWEACLSIGHTCRDAAPGSADTGGGVAAAGRLPRASADEGIGSAARGVSGPPPPETPLPPSRCISLKHRLYKSETHELQI